jgi:hypothetical protein
LCANVEKTTSCSSLLVGWIGGEGLFALINFEVFWVKAVPRGTPRTVTAGDTEARREAQFRRPGAKRKKSKANITGVQVTPIGSRMFHVEHQKNRRRGIPGVYYLGFSS